MVIADIPLYGAKFEKAAWVNWVNNATGALFSSEMALQIQVYLDVKIIELE